MVRQRLCVILPIPPNPQVEDDLPARARVLDQKRERVGCQPLESVDPRGEEDVRGTADRGGRVDDADLDGVWGGGDGELELRWHRAGDKLGLL